MKLYCTVCEDFHIDKDGFPNCGVLDKQGFSRLSREDKERLWNEIMMNPLLDELTVRYNINPRFTLVAYPSVALILASGKMIYLPESGLDGLVIVEEDIHDRGV